LERYWFCLIHARCDLPQNTPACNPHCVNCSLSNRLLQLVSSGSFL
jgi:hypothetical protein